MSNTYIPSLYYHLLAKVPTSAACVTFSSPPVKYVCTLAGLFHSQGCSYKLMSVTQYAFHFVILEKHSFCGLVR